MLFTGALIRFTIVHQFGQPMVTMGESKNRLVSFKYIFFYKIAF